MATIIPNTAKGRANYLAGLPAASDALIWVLLTGTETDDNLRDADHLQAIIALAVNEATFTGYSRQTATGVSVVTDDTANTQYFDLDDPTWSPTSAEALTRIVLCYDDATGSGTDANLIPLFIDTYALTTPTSGTIGYSVASGGPYVAS